MNKMKTLTLQGVTFEVVDEQARADIGALKENPSSGGGADLLDENGIIKQEYLPEGFPYRSIADPVIVPSTTLTADPDSGTYTIPNTINTLALSEDVKCVVKFEVLGYVLKFEVTPQEAPENDQGFKWMLGNTGLLDGSEGTGEPFLIGLFTQEVAAESGIGGMMAFTYDAESVMLSIDLVDESFSTIDPSYLPAGCATVVVKVRADFFSNGYEFKETTHTNAQILQSLSLGKNVILELRQTGYDTSADIYRLVGWGTSGATFSRVYSYVASTGNTNCVVDTIETSENLSDWTNTEARFVVNSVVAE
jgi:hypothetical protein